MLQDATQPDQPPPDDSVRFSRRGPAPVRQQPDGGHVTRAEFAESMGQLLDKLDDIAAGQETMPHQIAQAMAEALRDVLQEPQTAEVLVVNIRRAATRRAFEATGRGIWSAITGLLQKWLLVVVVLFVLAGAVGWGPAINVARMIVANQDGSR